MSGVKGRSGGPRQNSGGKRLGAGRKPKPPTDVDGDTPLDLLMAFAKDKNVPDALRIRAAGLAAQYMHLKAGDGGKKDARVDAAASVGAGKFGAAPPPKLVVNNR